MMYCKTRTWLGSLTDQLYPTPNLCQDLITDIETGREGASSLVRTNGLLTLIVVTTIVEELRRTHLSSLFSDP